MTPRLFLLLAALGFFLQGCETQEAITTVVLAVLGTLGVAVGIAGRKHNRNLSLEHQKELADARVERERRQADLDARQARRERERLLAAARRKAEADKVDQETLDRLAQVAKDEGVSNELLKELLKEIGE